MQTKGMRRAKQKLLCLIEAIVVYSELRTVIINMMIVESGAHDLFSYRLDKNFNRPARRE